MRARWLIVAAWLCAACARSPAGAPATARSAGGVATPASDGRAYEHQRKEVMALLRREAWEEAAAKAKAAVGALEEAGDSKDPGPLGDALLAWGRALAGARRHAAAATTLERARDVLVRARGAAGPDAAAVLVAMCVNEMGRGDFAAAQARCEEALALREKTAGASDAAAGEPLTLLARAHHARDDRRGAEALLTRATPVLEKDAAVAPLVEALDAAAQLHEDLDRHEAALALYRRADAMLDKAEWAEHPLRARVLRHASGLYRTMGDLSKARAAAERAVAIVEGAYRGDSPPAAEAQWNLGLVELAAGDVASAEQRLLFALGVLQRDLGPDHTDSVTLVLDLAEVFVLKKSYPQALANARVAVDGRRRHLGRDHTLVATAINNLATIHWEAGHYAKSRKAYEEALRIYETTSGKDSLDVATVVHNLGTVHYMRGEYAEAEPLFARALAIEERIAPRALKTGVATYNMAMLQAARGDMNKARLLFERALPIFEAATTDSHPDFVKVLDAMAMLYTRLGDAAAAERFRERAARARARAKAQ
jgi:tetratricopeptide (TPR) repeat protein